MKLPITLRQRLRSGHIIPFVGAGVSMSAVSQATGASLFPSWKTLLERAGQRLREEGKAGYADIVSGMLSIAKPKYLEAAKHAREGMGSVWYDFLKSQFDHTYDEADPESLTLARMVWSLGSNLVITTNYDRTLRWACPSPQDLITWCIEAPPEQASYMRQGAPHHIVWHLHGTIDNATSIILTPDGYSLLYPDKHAEGIYGSALHTLRSLLVTHSFLFIGFSLSDEAFGTQLRTMGSIFANSTGPHYVLAVERDSQAIVHR